VSTAVKALEFGAFHYLTKPIPLGDLEEVVDKAACLRRMARMKREAAELLDRLPNHSRAPLESSFYKALDSLWMAYQPILRASDGTIYGYEALLRSREATLPHPGAVLDAAERLDMLDVLGRTIRERSAEPMARAPEGAVLFVNLHTTDLLDPTLMSPDTPLSRIAKNVVLEITERASLDQVKDVRARVAALREMGFRIAVDDLGAGYAGLTSFALLEPEIVKLDMSLVRDVHLSSTKQKLVQSMTHLSQDMGMLVVGEGVENVEERDALVSLGCDLLQGYLFAKPNEPFPTVEW
jgi:EAL domain-containing protein (putative c-di-GMP-specific phosphodiesterase class I)